MSSTVAPLMALLGNRKCCAPGCTSRENQPPFPTFRMVPERNIRRRRIWLKLLNLPYPKVLKKCNNFICQKHFEKKYIDKNNRIKRWIFPTLFTQEEIEAGKSERYSNDNILGLAASDQIYWIGHYGYKSMSDHSYGCTPLFDQTKSSGFTPIPDHTYSIPVQQINNNIINENTADNDKEAAVSNNFADKEKEHEQTSEDKQKEENDFVDKERGENISADKEKGENNSEEKTKENMPKQPRKRKNDSVLRGNGPIYYINDNKENKSSNNNPNIIMFNNNNRDDNSTDNDNNATPKFVVLNNGQAVDNPKSIRNLLPDIKSLANIPNDNTRLKLYKLLVENNLINDNVNDNDVTDDDGSVDNDDNVFDPDVVENNLINDNVLQKKGLSKLICQYRYRISDRVVAYCCVQQNASVQKETEKKGKENDNVNDKDVTDDGVVDNDNNVFDPDVDNNISANDNPFDVNDEPALDLFVDHTKVIGDIVQNNLNNEEILEKIMTEIKRIESSLSDTIKTTNIVGGNKEFTENLDMNGMALINYNNTVVLCHKNDVAELKNNYPELVDQNDHIDQDIVTKVKRHRLLRHKRKPGFKKGVIKNSNTVNEDQEAVRNIPCACDANSACEHKTNPLKIPSSRVLIFCDHCKIEHSVNYKFCKRNAPKPSPKKEIIKTKKGNLKRYVTVKKFEQVTGNLQSLLQTSQQIQGQLNSLSTVLTTLVNAVSKIEKPRKEIKKRTPRKPRTSRKKVKESLPEQEPLRDQESLLVNKHILEEKVNLREKIHIKIEVHSREQETLCEQESLPENRVLHDSKPPDYLPVNIPLPGNKCLPEREILPVHGTLSTEDYFPGNRGLLEKQYLLANRSLPML